VSTRSVEAEGISIPAVAAPVRPNTVAELSCRLLDIAVSVALLVLLAPLFALIAVAIRLDTGGPVFFRQSRLGLGLSEFAMNKFRTMHTGISTQPHREYVVGLIRAGDSARPPASEGIYKLESDPRVTRVGRVLRRFSLDELPQLWNVLRGDMSLVGPRPALPYEVEHYPAHWYERFSVRPGITGLWQVSGRNHLTFDQMVDLDLDYAQRRSFWLNLRILAKTPWVMVHGKGAA
jgi:lipopolysaccharide/colanic/teichoic acid biosynthesis glycosyltransferase